MNRARLLVLGAVVGVLAIVAAVFGVMAYLNSQDEKRDREAAEKAAQSAAAASSSAAAAASSSAAAEASRSAEQQAVHDTCEDLTQPLYESLREIDSRLDVGLNYSEYGDYLGAVQVQYDNVIRKLEDSAAEFEECLDVAIPLENALNRYNKVLNIWGDCLDDYNCDFSEGQTNIKAQLGWARASAALDKRDEELKKLAP